MGSISRGRRVQDKDNVGGLHKVYFIKIDESRNGFPTTIGYDSTNTRQINELLNGGSATGETLTIYQYDLQGTSEFNETENNSRENGTVFYEQVLTLNLKNYSANDAFDTYELATSRWAIVVEGKNGGRRLVGLEYGAEKSGTSNIGGGMGDGSNTSYIFTAMEKVPANFLGADALNTASGAAGEGITITGGPAAS